MCVCVCQLLCCAGAPSTVSSLQHWKTEACQGDDWRAGGGRIHRTQGRGEDQLASRRRQGEGEREGERERERERERGGGGEGGREW